MNNFLYMFMNDGLPIWSNIILWVNLIGAIIATYYNYKAAHEGLTSLRRVHFIITGFAFGYALGYFALLLFDIPFWLWSEWFRGVSMAVWILVWSAPAIASMKIWKELQKLLKDHMEDDT